MARTKFVKKNLTHNITQKTPSKKKSPEEIAARELQQKQLAEAKEYVNNNYTKEQVYMARVLSAGLVYNPQDELNKNMQSLDTNSVENSITAGTGIRVSGTENYIETPMGFLSVDFYNKLHSYLSVHKIDTTLFINSTFVEIKRNELLSQSLIKNPESIFNAMLFAAEIGLWIGEGIGDLFLLADKIKNEDGKEDILIKPQIGYKGFITLLYRGDIVKNLWAECVFEGDKFEYELGLTPKLSHVPVFTNNRNAQNITHVYSVAKLSNGETQFVLMSRKEVEAVRDLIKSNSLYFNDKSDPNHWMVKKVAIKQLAKLIPKDYYTKKALEYDNGIERGAYLEVDKETNQIKLTEPKSIKSKKKGIYDLWD